MKDRLFFTHDFFNRHKPSMIQLQISGGYQAKGFYWDLIEALHENHNALAYDNKALSVMFFGLSPDWIGEAIEKMVELDLIQVKSSIISCREVKESLNKISNKRKAAEKAINTRWQKTKEIKDKDTVVLQTNYKRNTIREEKRREEKRRLIGEYVHFDPKKAEELKQSLGPEIFEASCQKLDNWVGQMAPADGEKPSKEFKKRKQNAYNASNTFSSWVVRAVKEERGVSNNRTAQELIPVEDLLNDTRTSS